MQCFELAKKELAWDNCDGFVVQVGGTLLGENQSLFAVSWCTSNETNLAE